MKKQFKSMVQIREDIVEAIKAANIEVVTIAYEAGVSPATVYNFINRKSYNQKIIDWYLNKEE